jgi:CubicO group peptidase (beta-lactamase class C family)
LTLVDRGVLSLDTDMTALYPPLKEASKQILTGFKENGEAILKPNDKPITLLQMLNQSSGFGMEFGETVQAWKKVTPKGKGYVNSCKVVCISIGLRRRGLIYRKT